MAGRTLQEIKTFMDISFAEKKDYRIIKNVMDFHSVIQKITECDGLIGFDTETSGTVICSLPWGAAKKDYLVGLCLSWEDDQGIYIPVKHTQFDNISMELIIKHLFPLLEKKPLATHNGIFDYKVLYDLGCRINIVHDSMLLIFNICSKLAKGSKALKNLTRLLYGITTIEFSDIFSSTKDYTRFADIEEEVCRIYACADPDYTRRIVLDHVGFLTATQMGTYMDDCHFIPLIAEAEYYGKPINMEQMRKDRQTCINNIKYMEDIIFNYVGWKLTGDIKARYTFKESSSDELVDVMYKKLRYKPVDSKNKSGYKIDKFVLKRLASIAREDGQDDEFVKNIIKADVPNLLDPEKPLINYKKTVKCLNVLALFIISYRKQVKELTSFFNKIHNESDQEQGVYYSSISMTNTETSRLVDFMQTLDGGLKYLVQVKDCAKQYMFVFDFAQIEYRVMVALACMHAIVTQLDDPHTDFHVVIAALILNVKPEDITDEVRKKFKSINFGIPYGMAVKGLVDSIYGIGLSKEEYDKAVEDVSQRLDAWCKALPEIITMLNCYRDIATTPREYEHTCTSGFHNTGFIQSPDGRARVFELGDMSKQLLSKVRRMAGNFPIQCYAAYLFKTAVNSLRERLISEGFMNILVEDSASPSGKRFHSKVTFNGFIHDEAIGFADNDVNPAYLMKLIQEECMIKLVGHPTYYCGINIVRNWGEGKEGKYEAPIDFVKAYAGGEPIVAPRTDWPEVVASEIVSFCNKASVKYVEGIAGERLTKDHILNVESILPKWKDYYHKKKIKSYGQRYRPDSDVAMMDDKGKQSDEDKLINKLGGILISHGYEDLLIEYSHRQDKVTKVIEGINPSNKEIEYASMIYEGTEYTDYENYDELEDFDIDLDETSTSNVLLTEMRQANVSTLSKFLTSEFG